MAFRASVWRMIDEGLLSEAQIRFQQEGRLVRLPAEEPIVFVGDTHGDLEATKQVFARFPAREHVIVFLGDYVDRGPDSAGNLDLLLATKLAHPERVFLLMGNHEGWAVVSFSPADFWQRLSPHEERAIAQALSEMPFAAWHPRGVLALHGALPDVDAIEEIEDIAVGSPDWRRITWGDWADTPGYVVDPGVSGRPTFGRDAFETIADRLGVKALVRSHQPSAPALLFEERCLTIFTSTAYGGTVRRVAVLRPEKPLESARDLELVTL